MRRALDSLFSGKETCLSAAFDQVLSKRSDRSLHVVVTDAEQSVTEDSLACPMGVNLAPTQDRLYEWVQKEHRFAAIVALRLPYEGWQMAAGGSRDYCDCKARNLFVYLLGPSADAVERAYLTLLEHWKGSATDITYLPLAPRAAGQFRVEAKILSSGGDARADLKLGDLANPAEKGRLPVFSVRLEAKQATLSFAVSGPIFETPELAKKLGSDWPALPAEAFLWEDRPLALAPSTSQHKPGAPSDQAGDSGLVFTRLANDQAGSRAKYHWDGSYLARAAKEPVAGKGKELISGVWEIRRRSDAAHGCDLFLFEVRAKGSALADRLIAASPLLRGPDLACTGIGTLAAQVRHVARETPVVRFLVHVDW